MDLVIHLVWAQFRLLRHRLAFWFLHSHLFYFHHGRLFFHSDRCSRSHFSDVFSLQLAGGGRVDAFLLLSGFILVASWGGNSDMKLLRLPYREGLLLVVVVHL